MLLWNNPNIVNIWLAHFNARHWSDLHYWDRVTHISVSKLTSIGSDNGLSLGRRKAIIWTNAGILLIGPLWTKFSEILIEILRVSFKKIRLKRSSAKWQPFCLGLNVLIKVQTPLPKNATVSVYNCLHAHKLMLWFKNALHFIPN